MKKYGLLLVFACRVCFAAEVGSLAAAAPELGAGSKMWAAEFRAGFVTKTPDQAVLSKWEHQPLESYAYALGIRRSFPQAWSNVRFYGGTEFQYLTSKEELSGDYTATIESEFTEWMAEGGAIFRWAVGGAQAAGFRLGTKFILWGEKTAKLDAQEFNQDLGRESSQASRDLIGFPVIFVISGFYQLSDWQLSLNVDSRPHGSALTAGVGYVF